MKIDTDNNRIIAVAIAVALSLVPIRLAAQHNKAQIDDEVFAIYQEADKNRLTGKGLQLSEQAYELAVRKGDKKAQSMALCTEIFYYYKRRDTNGLKKVIDRILKVSKANGQKTYYYFAWAKWIEYNINENELLTALQEAQKMNAEALSETTTNHYVITTSYRTLANVYWGRLDYDRAAKYYTKALDYSKKYIPKQDASILYVMLSKYYVWKKDFKRACELIDEGISRANGMRNLGSLYVCRATACFWMNDKKNFFEAVSKVDAIKKEYGIIDSNVGLPVPVVEVMRLILLDDIDGASKKAAEVNYEEERLICQRLIARAQNNSKELYDVSDKLLDLYINSFAQVYTKDVEEISRTVDEIQFKADKFQLELELANSNNAKMKLEKEKLLAREKMKDLEFANSQLKLSEAKTTDSLNRAKIAIQEQNIKTNEEKIAKEEEAHRLHVTIFALVITFLFAILVNEWMNKRKAQVLIEKLRKTNSNLEEAKGRAEESSRMKTMFVQNVSHEIRTPLNAIVGFADLLVNPEVELGDDERNEFASIIHHNSDLLTSLVNDVLVLSELQSGKAQANVAPCKCNELCRSSIDTVLHRKPKDVSLDFTTDIADDFTVITDSRRLNQVIINFLTNAEKYTTQGSIVLDCSASKKPGYVMFSVTDTGCGIPPEKQDQIFERFEKLDDFHQGMGIGLHICTLVAQLLNAQIGIDKQYTHGSRFYIAVRS